MIQHVKEKVLKYDKMHQSNWKNVENTNVNLTKNKNKTYIYI